MNHLTLQSKMSQNSEMNYFVSQKYTVLYALAVCILLSVTLTGCNGGKVSDRTSGGVSSLKAFEQTLYPIVETRCNLCHAESGPQNPQFAHIDVNTAFQQVQAIVDLVQPANSRIAKKVAGNHRCWGNCSNNSQEMVRAIDTWKAMVNSLGGNTVSAIKTVEVPFSSGVKATLNRFDANVIALYEFKEGTGTVASDTSGVAPAMDLTLSDVEWVAGGPGISLGAETSRAFVDDTADPINPKTKKLYDNIAATGASNEYTVEAWIAPMNVAQGGPARIVTYSSGSSLRNFTMGQEMDYYVFRARSNSVNEAMIQIDDNGQPSVQTIPGAGVVQPVLQHLVMTYDQTAGRKIFVNGLDTGVIDTYIPVGPTSLSGWGEDYAFILGDEIPGTSRPWLGTILFVAVHNAALTPEQILQNFEAGSADRFILSFDVSEFLGADGSIVQFEVSELDEYSYLLGKPTFVGPVTSDFPIKNIKIGVNNSIPDTGQTFKNLDEVVSASGQLLSRMGAVVPKGNGPGSDNLFLTFEVLGNNSDVVTEFVPSPPILSFDETSQIELGVRTFEQINETMSAITKVSPTVPDINAAFEGLKQQLPSVSNLDSISSSHQIGIAKLALEYCDALVNNATLRTNFFGDAFNFGALPPVAFDSDVKRDLIFNSLVNNMFGEGLSTQPTLTEIRTDINGLVTNLLASPNCNNTTAECTQTVVKMACTSVLASASITIR